MILTVSTKEKGTQNLSGIHLVRSFAYEPMRRKERPLTVILRRVEDVGNSIVSMVADNNNDFEKVDTNKIVDYTIVVPKGVNAMGLSLRDGYVGSTPYTIVKSVKENSFAYS